MHHQLELAYLGIQVPDPKRLTPLFGDVIGLVPGEPASGGVITWRNDDKAHRVIIEPGPANDAVYVGFEAVGDRAFATAVSKLEAAGYPVHEASDDTRAARRVERLVSTTAPWGTRVEIVRGLHDATATFDSALMPTGFLTRGLGFGHTVFATTAFDESHSFLVDGLGMVQTDWVETEIAEGIELLVRFYHCNPRHHSFALARAPFELPHSLHHVMVESNSPDDVGAAFDRAWAAGLAIPMGLGRHDNDHVFSFYVASPAGFQVEVGHGSRPVTDDWDENRRYDRTSVWGHQPLRPA